MGATYNGERIFSKNECQKAYRIDSGGAYQHLDDSQMTALLDQIQAGGRIFTVGTGRSGVAMKAFTNRLMHLVLQVSSIGEITTPHTTPGDLLIIGSGSGETESLVAMARRAKKSGVRVALITTTPTSTIAGLADTVVYLPGVSPKTDLGEAIQSFQPMANAFEQMSFLVYDALIMELMDRMGETGETMFTRHANLE